MLLPLLQQDAGCDSAAVFLSTTAKRDIVMPPLHQRAIKILREHNKKVALTHGFAGARARILPWHCLQVVRIGFPSWRTVPPLCSSCLALLEALDRNA